MRSSLYSILNMRIIVNRFHIGAVAETSLEGDVG